ncbi:MAG: ferrous iron transport protein B [Bacteroidota bacterium]
MNRLPHIALVGNPNSGKSSLFNVLTGLNQKVGNFPGVTVEKKSGKCKLDADTNAEIIDLPGSYSLYPRRLDEWVAYEVLMEQDKDLKPDIVLVVADACNLKRNLLFVSQLIDLKIPTVLALTMLDVAAKKQIRIQTTELQRALGIPVIEINPRKESGIAALKKALVSVHKGMYKPPAFDFINNRSLAPGGIQKIKQIFPSLSDYAAIHYLIHYKKFEGAEDKKNKIEAIIQQENINATRVQADEIIQRYKRIQTILQLVVTQTAIVPKEMLSEKIDKLLLHKSWGYVILLSVLFLLFQSVFWIAEYPMSFIENSFVWIEEWFTPLLAVNQLTHLFLQGVLPGLSGILVFVPQIMILFGLIGLLEETGYMARISFLSDKIMRKAGLNGKSVMPMISGFACAVPAIMSVRNIESQRERLLTILVTPLMSCSARLPVYTILIALVVPGEYIFGVLSLQGLVMMGLYLFGILMALLVARIAKIFIQIKEKSFFVLELPLYKTPRWKNIGYTMIEKAKIFIIDAGKIIMIISLLLWFLSNYGPATQMESVHQQYKQRIEQNPAQAESLKKEEQAALLQVSYAGQAGKIIEPIIRPLGYDWKIGIALITSFAAREVFVGTMATLYSVNGEDDASTLREKMQTATWPNGNKVYTLASGVSLMLFYLLAMQCMSTLAVVKRETNSWKWPMIQLAYMTALAYLISFAAYQILS